MTSESDAATHASDDGVHASGPPGFDLASWGIARTPPRSPVGARVPNPVAEQWTAAVAGVAATHGISKGNAAACGLLVALSHMDEWASLAKQVGGEGGGEAEVSAEDHG